jgi:hypothetical protein
MPDLSKIYLFRMTHIGNIPHILQYGITHLLSANTNKNYIPIGDPSLISNRNSFLIQNGKTLGQYIPFYFGVRMPMLYVIQKGYNGVNTTQAEDIVYCITNVQQIISHNLPFVFTDGHAVDGFSSFYNSTKIFQIDSIIDTKAIHAKYWKDENDLDLKRRKEAEFLIESDLPPTAIIGWVVYNEKAKSKLLNLGIVTSKILVDPESYF